jgi:hypothetical protein
MGAAAGAIITTLTAMDAAITALELEQRINQDFEHHPDAAIYHSMPALGPILSARVLGEFGDEPARWPDPVGRRAYTSISTDFREMSYSRRGSARAAAAARAAPIMPSG